jgi:hypothetical protein
MTHSNFVYIWQYSIDLERESEFLAAYQSDGDWAKLFSRDPNYIRTELLQDSSKQDVYMTIDYWTSKSARDSFRETHSTEFANLDERCESYTVHEVLIGDFVINEAGAT